MPNAEQFNPYNHPQQIPAEHGPLFWFVIGAITALSLVLIYLSVRF